MLIRGTDGALWRVTPDGSERTRIDQTVAAFQPINAAVIYVARCRPPLWREIGDASKRTEVDHTVKDFQAIDMNLVFVLGADGQLWRETGSAASRALSPKTSSPSNSPGRRHRRRAGRRRGAVAKKRQRQGRQVHQGSRVPGDETRRWCLCSAKTDGLGKLARAQEAALVDRDVLVTAGKAAFHADDPADVMVLGSDHRLWAGPCRDGIALDQPTPPPRLHL